MYSVFELNEILKNREKSLHGYVPDQHFSLLMALVCKIWTWNMSGKARVDGPYLIPQALKDC